MDDQIVFSFPLNTSSLHLHGKIQKHMNPDKQDFTMDLTDIRSFCAELPGSLEDFPFDETTLVFKVGKKMYALAPTTGSLRLNLKCDPDEAQRLRETYPFVLPGYHMHKRHWNTILVEDCTDDALVYGWIQTSYDLVFASLTRKERDALRKDR